MLAALLVLLLLSGGSSAFLDHIAESKDAVKTVVVDAERRKEALRILQSMQARSKEQTKQVEETVKRLSKLIEGRNQNAEEMATIGERHFNDLDSYDGDILDLRFELREHVTRAEWAQIFVTNQP